MTAPSRSPSRTRTIRFLTPEELKTFLGVIRDKRDRAIFLVGYRHGLRASEMGLLRTSDLDLKGLRLMVHRLKGSHSGEHPLQPDEVRVLKAYLRARASKSPILFPSRRHTPISRRTLDWLMKRYGERAGVPRDKRHFHCLKHSIATHMLSPAATWCSSRTGSVTATSRTPGSTPTSRRPHGTTRPGPSS